MKGTLSRMWRSGLAMMLALIMMFSLGTVAFATEGSAKNFASNVVDIFANEAEDFNAKAFAKYVYASFEEQGYVALVVDALEAAKAGLVAAKNEVAETADALSPELKAELKAALEQAEQAVADLIDVVKTVDDVNSDKVKAAAKIAVSKIESVKVVADKIGAAGTLDDALLLKNLVVKAADAALTAANKLVDLMVAAIYDATHETITVPCAGYKVAAVGDASVQTYAADVAKNLGAEYVADVNDADLVLMGYGLVGMTEFVVDQLIEDGELAWEAVFEDTGAIKAAVAAAAEKLAAAGLSREAVDAAIISLESYAYAYAKYILDYPVEAKNIAENGALVAVVGMYNPLKGIALTEGDVSVDLGLALEGLVEASGIYNLASAIMLKDVIYVDVTDAGVVTKMAPASVSVKELPELLLKADEMLPATGDEIEAAVMKALDVVYSGHVAVPVEAVEADCVTAGCTAGTKCAVCGIVLEGCEEVAALGHDWDEGKVTGHEKFLKTQIVYTCKRCGETKNEAYDKFHQHFFDGYPEGDFRPEGSITRAEVAVVFYAMLNDHWQVADEEFKYAGTFSDVAENEWFAKQVEVLASLGLVAGYPNGTFDPWAPITRAEFATMAVALGQFEVDGTELFPDVAESDWFYDFVRTAANNGLVVGYPDGDFRPEANITRAESAVVASALLGRPYEGAKEFFDHYKTTGKLPLVAPAADGSVADWADLRVLSDVEGHWAYYWLLIATNDHYHVIVG